MASLEESGNAGAGDVAARPHPRPSRCGTMLGWDRKDMLAFSMLWYKSRILLGRSAALYIFAFFLLPALLVFMVGISRLGLQGISSSIGVGPQLPLSLSLAPYATASAPLVWSDDTTTAARVNTSAIMLSVAGALPDGALQRVSSRAALASMCGGGTALSQPCFAGVSFSDADGTSALVNVTILYALNSIPFGLTVNAPSRLTAAGVTSLEAALERAVAAAVNTSLASTIAAATVSTQTFTSISQAQLNVALYGYFFDFLSTTGAVAFVAIFLPHVYWLAHTLATETEARLKEIMFVMGLHSRVYYAAAVAVYTVVCAPSWLLMSAIFGLLVFSSDFASLLLLTVLTGVAVCMQVLLLTQFITRARFAGLLAMGTVFATGMVGLAVSRTPPDVLGRVAAIVLFSPAGFVIGVVSLSRAEEAAQRITSSTWSSVVASQGLSFGALLASMCVNILLTGFAAWYASQVVPGQFGVPKRWNWLCTRATATRGGDASTVATPFLPHADLLFDAVETRGDAIVRIRDLTKTFHVSGTRLTAVDGLSLDLHAGEVFVLLGRNGCGKTSTISALVGLSTPDGGDAWVDGARITRDMDAVRTSLGMCPQHDALWPDLTVRQTLALYAGIKGVPRHAVDEEVSHWLARVGLSDKADALAATLSGGMKRKLSITIAFIGGSKVILLDEPSAGVDPHSRRAIWDIINSNRQGRVILLTTHFLDEADVLADRIGIMASGRLRGLGSPAFLKQSLGFGYNLTAAFENATGDHAAALLACVTQTIPEARVVSDRGRDVVIALPLSANASVPATLRALEMNAAALQLSACGVNSASLQEVFLRLVGASDVDHAHPHVIVSPLAVTAAATGPQPSTTAGTKLASSSARFHALLWKRFLLARKDWRTTLVPLLLTAVMAIVVALVKTDKAACPSSLLVVQPPSRVTQTPATPLYPGLGFIITPSQAAFSSTLGPAQLLSAASPFALTSALQVNASSIWGGAALAPGASASSAWPSMVSISNIDSDLLTSAASLNAVTNALFAAASASATPQLVTTALQPFPTKLAAFDSRDWTPLLIIMGVIVLCGSFTVPLASTVAVARENAGAGALKQQQRMAGVTPLEYWGSHMVWDLVLIVSMSLIAAAGVSASVSWLLPFGWTLLLFFLYHTAAVLLGYIFTFVVSSQSASLALTAGYLFLVSIGVLVTVITQLDDLQGAAVTGVTYGGFIINPMASMFMSVMYSTNLIFISCAAAAPGLAPSVLTSYALVGRPLVFLAAQVLVFSGVVLFLERRMELQLWLQARQAAKRASVQKRGPQDWVQSDAGASASACNGTIRVANAMHSAAALDADIAAEVSRVEAGASDDAAIAMHLRKEYDNGAKIAVHDLCLGLHSREAFGLLGTNGAGKTSTLQMMTGQILPTSGDVVVHGHSLVHDIAGVQASVGVCPQHDVLWDELSAEQHLQLYAALKGVNRATQSSEVSWLVSHLDLGPHAFKPSGALSGGNKRKLSVAIACVGAPPVIVLDEPSTGMDPAAKRFMWGVIAGMQREHTVVLTTHSMEECEAVAERLGIMVAGRLVALGGAQHIKTAHGAAYQIDAVCADAAAADSLVMAVTSAFPSTRVLEHQLTHVRMAVSRTASPSPSLAQVFDAMEGLRTSCGIVTYQASQTSLEQVFLDLASSGREERGHINEALGSGSYSQLPWDGFTLRAIVLNLVLGPVVSMLCWGLLLAALLLTLAFLWLPPLASAFAACTLHLLKSLARQELSMVTRYGSLDPRRDTPECDDSIFPGQAAVGGDGCCFRSWRTRVAPIFSSPRLRQALVFMLITRVALCMAALAASTALLAVGVGTLVLLPYTSVQQRRLALWQRQLVYASLAAPRAGGGAGV